MIVQKKSMPIFSIPILGWCLLFSSVSVFAYDAVDRQREENVALIQSGQIDKGIDHLKILLDQYPNRQKLLADYITVAYQNHLFNQDILLYLPWIQTNHFPLYGQISLIKGLRDLKQYSLALDWVKSFSGISKEEFWKVWIAVLQLESGDTNSAKKTVNKIKPEVLAADYLALLSYVYRSLDMPLEALKSAKLAYGKDKSKDVVEQYILALMVNADYTTAQNVLSRTDQYKEISHIKYLVKQHEYSQRIKDAVQFYKIAMYKNRGNQAYQLLDQVIADMARDEGKLPDIKDVKNIFYYDYIYALNQRNRADDALAQISKISVPVEKMPPYARHAIADAYLKTKKNKPARSYYLSLLNEKNYPDFDLYSNLYYSNIELEKYNEANQLIKNLDKWLPIYQYSQAKGIDRITHPEREEYLSLVGLNYAYRNQLNYSEQYFKDLLKKAPNNIAYQNNLATVLRWREKPEASEKILSLWNSVEPVDSATRINHMQNAQALGKINEWRTLNEALLEDLPHDSGVILSRKELADRDRASIVHESVYGHSKSDNSGLLNQLNGSNEYDGFTRISSPWFQDYFRAFLTHEYRNGKFDNNHISDQKVGLGMQWEKDRKTTELVLSDRLKDDRFGFQFDWSHWLNDHWQYELGFNSQANIPLQAIQDKYKGQSYSFGINWQKNESNKSGVQYQVTDINDGNFRQEISAYFRDGIYRSPYHLTDISLSGYYSKNKDIQTNYFNPLNSHSAELTLDHNWITWREHNRGFNQYFQATVGQFWQKDYSSKPIYNLLYRHDWKLSRTWALNYGAGWGVHPYDGDDEEKIYAVLGFNGVF